MVAAGLAGLLCGYALGLRFRILVLVPVELVGIMVGFCATAFGIVSGSAALVAFVIFSICLQASYFVALAYPVAVRSVAPNWVEA